MKTVLVIDASAVISLQLSEIDYEEGYIPQAVADELKCKSSNSHIDMHMYKIKIRNPTEEYIRIAEERAGELGHTGLSRQDIELAALALKVSEEYGSVFSSWIGPNSISGVQVVAVTQDNMLKTLLRKLGVQLNDSFHEFDRKYLQRCFTCTKIYKTEEKIDFCKSCGYPTVTRVAYKETDGKIELFLSKNYKYTEKVLEHRGKPILSQDQKEYKWYKKSQRNTERKDRMNYEKEIRTEEWRI